MLAVSVIDLLRFAVVSIGASGALLLFYFAYDIGKDGEWREEWPFVVFEGLLGCIALILTVGLFAVTS